MAAHLEPYRYRDLKDPSRQIRIMTLAPAQDFHADLECSLATANLLHLPRLPRYRAVSYVWGSPDQEFQPLICEGQLLLIPGSLQLALRYFRRTKGTRRLWTDAICINQDNISEKTMQIQQMGRIYAKAWTTLIWLGEPQALLLGPNSRVPEDSPLRTEIADAIDEGFRIVHKGHPITFLEAQFDKLRGRFPLETAWLDTALPDLRTLWEESGASSYIYRELRGKFILRHLKKQRWDTQLIFELLMAHPWFTRVWTLQEVWSSPRSFFICGTSRIRPMDFADIVHRLNRKTLPEAAQSRLEMSVLALQWNRQPIFRFVIGRNLRSSSQSMYWMFLLVSLINASCMSTATKPKDNVIGASAIFRSLGAAWPMPDYSRTIAELCADATRSLLVLTNGLLLLNFASGPPRRSHSGDHGDIEDCEVPSWAIDWRRGLRTDNPLWRSYLDPYRPPRAKAATSHSVFNNSSSDSAPGELVVEGRVFAPIVKSLAPLANTLTYYGSHSATWATWLCQLVRTFGPHSRHTVVERLIELHQCTCPALHPFGEEFTVLWEVTVDVLNTSTADINEDIRRVQARAEFQTLDTTFLLRWLSYFKNLSPVMTDSGEIGLVWIVGPAPKVHDAQEEAAIDANHLVGCVVALVAGLDYPVVLRATPDGDKWYLVGTAAVSGMMKGQLWPEKPDELSKIVLV